MTTSQRTFLGTVVAVAASSAALPSVTGYGTNLFQFVALGGWATVAAIASDAFADQNHIVVWSVATLINVVLFAVPAAVIYSLLRLRNQRACVVALLVWVAFYLSSLFFLFPATDGP
jgi:hypothetical protein